MSKFITVVTKFLHIMYFLFIIITPFSDSNYMLMLHAIMVPFMMVHWVCNNDTCALTIGEKIVRKIVLNEKDNKNCITCKIIEPVYNFKKDNKKYKKIIYTITFGLWMITLLKLYYRYKIGYIKNIYNMFVI